MTVQTSYDLRIDQAYAGMRYGDNPHRSNTWLVEGGSIGMGIAVTEGSTPKQATAGGTGTFCGITERDLKQQAAGSANTLEYQEFAAMAVLEWGDIFVNITNTGSRGDPIYFVQADGTIAAGTAGAGQTQIVGGVLEEDVASAGTIARIRIKEGN